MTRQDRTRHDTTLSKLEIMALPKRSRATIGRRRMLLTDTDESFDERSLTINVLTDAYLSAINRGSKDAAYHARKLREYVRGEN